MITRYCTICDSILVMLEVDFQKQRCCQECSRVESGYVIKERPVVEDLRNHLPGNEHLIRQILAVFRYHGPKMYEGGQ